MHVASFLVVAIVVVVTPGVDVALVQRPRVRAAVDDLSGVVFSGLGARLALARR